MIRDGPRQDGCLQVDSAAQSQQLCSHLRSRGLAARSVALAVCCLWLGFFVFSALSSSLTSSHPLGIGSCAASDMADDAVLGSQSNEGRVMLRRACSCVTGTPCSSIRAVTVLRVAAGNLPVGTPPKLEERPGTTPAHPNRCAHKYPHTGARKQHPVFAASIAFPPCLDCNARV